MSNEQHVALIKQGTDVWNEWVTSGEGVKADMREVEVTALFKRLEHLTVDYLPHLSDEFLGVPSQIPPDVIHSFRADLSGAHLGNAMLRYVKLSNANLTNVNCYGADLRNAELSGACLIGADLREADLRDADLETAVLQGSSLSKAKLEKAIARRADFTNARLDHADLTGADLIKAQLCSADLSEANLSNSNLQDAVLAEANLSQATLRQANLRGADLRNVNLREADLSNADLSGADLSGANLISANLSGAKCLNTQFVKAIFIASNLKGADLTGAMIYGISAWDVMLDGAVQRDLVITPKGAATIVTADDLEIAQFLYLLLNNQRIRRVINTITSKVVLILGRFTSDRKRVLDALRDALRKSDYLPVLFDFDTPSTQTTLETVATLAGMARFVVADLTDAKSVLQELREIVPSRPSLAVQPLLLASQAEPGMWDYFRRFHWVLKPCPYSSEAELISNLAAWVIEPAERKVKELRRRRE